MNDLRYAARSLRHHPGFTCVTALLIALGIGANAVMFSALDAVMLKKLAAREPERLFRVVTNLPPLGRRSYLSPGLMQALAEKSKLVENVFGEIEQFQALTQPAPAEQIRVRRVTPNFFTALGVNAVQGRVLAAGDVDAAVVSYKFAEQRFAANAVGRAVTVGGHRYTIVGVLPREFNGISMDTGPEVRVPLGELSKDDQLELSVRFKHGVSAEQAAAEINSIRNAVEPKAELEFADHVELEPLEHGISRLRDRFQGALGFLLAAAGVLLLMMCANVAGLLLARSAARRGEWAVRLALGATRGRLMRQMLAENLLLAAIGGAAGLAIAFAATPLVERAIPPQRDFSTEIVPLTIDLHADWRVLAFSIGICAVTAILFGLAPAWSASRAAVHDALRGARATAGSRGRQALTIFQVALSTVLLAGAGLLIRTFDKLDRVDTGFDRDHVVTFTVNPELAGETAQQAEGVKQAWIERVRALAGVRSVATATIAMMRGSGMKATVGMAGARLSRADFMNTSLNRVSPEYFETMGIRLLEGRTFAPGDAAGPPYAAIVNQAFARRVLGNQDPIGRTIGGGAPGAIVKGSFTIVGVVSDAKYRSLREPIQPVEYLPALAASNDRFILHVRTANEPESTIGPVREALRAIDPAMPVIETHTLAQEVSDSLWSDRLVAMLASAFGALAAVLTAVGLYGLIAFAVTQRRREIGIRMALGAGAVDISRAVAIPALRMAIAGVLAGVGASLLVAPLIGPLLYQISPIDPVSLSISGVFLLLAAGVAILGPLLRALRIDPAIALRFDT
ncbi:MAG TPA: ABC transporter permease [Bryobacteraceae bacterium]|nr:ABC transporter permease [Bryobacteraceae bacterium]